MKKIITEYGFVLTILIVMGALVAIAIFLNHRTKQLTNEELDTKYGITSSDSADHAGGQGLGNNEGSGYTVDPATIDNPTKGDTPTNW